MQKPTIIAREDFFQNLISLINNSELPLFVVKDVMNLVLIDVNNKCREEYEKTKIEYENSMREDASKQGFIDTLKKLEQNQTDDVAEVT